MANFSLYGLIGKDLSHSFSERYFREKFACEGITDAAYRNFPIAAIEDLPRLLEENPDLKGFNVTIPYKESIIPYLSEIDEDAAHIGAVNCVAVQTDIGDCKLKPTGHTGRSVPVSRQGEDKVRLTGYNICSAQRGLGGFSEGRVKLIGYNTDAPAFRDSLLGFIGNDRPSALVLGTGGASKAICYVLTGLGIEYSLVWRTSKTDALNYADITGTVVASNRLIINTTPLGTWPLTDRFPDIPYEYLTPEHFLFDLVYNPDPTEFLRRGISHGAKTLNGLGMLIGQAERSWDIWQGRR